MSQHLPFPRVDSREVIANSDCGNRDLGGGGKSLSAIVKLEHTT